LSLLLVDRGKGLTREEELTQGVQSYDERGRFFHQLRGC
jgi:hypothetical protein